ncbi:hypothetical protein SCLARK_00670 [Spiroplasma clarkii]|uniref:Uncharacterized protein n=1 Tax=Spiroplasma clarkii TaxID=2139 RepID=A0A1Y0L033_9MOLU|nr:hypothetical protein [Spiroplasma clarkii]ARU91333.1 hypothetical protein SCLARK_00670 [Spiroplasma clarkii]ATX70756.1 hypothetical protein SCLAR_v1c04320 [Spiroplasma clarkii]
MLNALISVFAVLILIPLFTWAALKLVKNSKGYQVWFKPTIKWTFIGCYLTALVILIIIIVLAVL